MKTRRKNIPGRGNMYGIPVVGTTVRIVLGRVIKGDSGMKSAWGG